VVFATGLLRGDGRRLADHPVMGTWFAPRVVLPCVIVSPPQNMNRLQAFEAEGEGVRRGAAWGWSDEHLLRPEETDAAPVTQTTDRTHQDSSTPSREARRGFGHA
jgi:hypothetical protein